MRGLKLNNAPTYNLRVGGFIVLLLLGLLVPKNSFAQGETTRILFLVDASLSMRNQWIGGNKWNTAIQSVSDIADSVSKLPNVEIGMRVFGHLFHEPDKNCKDSRLEVPIAPNNAARIKAKLLEIKPKGITPLVYSIEKCATDFKDAYAKNIMIVITDGEDACEGDPCAVALMLQRNNIILRPFIIGMSLQQKSFADMECIGKLYNTGSKEDFNNTLKKVVTESIAKTSLQINLNDAKGKPTETDVNMSLYDAETGLLKYNFYHTLNARGLPDTITVSPMFKYRLQVHTIPPVIVNNLELEKDKHTVVNVDAPQGFLNFSAQGSLPRSSATERIKCLLHKSGDDKTIAVQSINTTEKYITGTYELEVITLPRLLIKNVKIDQSKTTDVQIPVPGILTLNKTFDAYGGIFVEDGGKIKKIYDLQLQAKQEIIALQPGKYRIVYRSKNARTIHTTVDKEFDIASGGSLSLKL